ncbi:MAG: Dna2/Cas4 domain-containing protein, partial [Bacteroidetes bacterium]
DKMEEAHVAQVKFYLYLLHCNGVEDARGIIEYPRLRQRTEVPPLDEADRQEVEGWIERVREVVEQRACPPVIREPVCKRCAYFDYCYSE